MNCDRNAHRFTCSRKTCSLQTDQRHSRTMYTVTKGAVCKNTLIYSLTQIYVFLQITSNTSYINIAFGTNRFRSRAPFVIKLPLITVLNEIVINVSIYSSLTIYNKKDLNNQHDRILIGPKKIHHCNNI